MSVTIKLHVLTVMGHQRGRGFLEGVLTHGALRGDAVEIGPEVLTYLMYQHPSKTLGLGDAFHSVAHPLAKAIDLLLDTKLADCVGCTQRRIDWNAIGARLQAHLSSL